MRIPIPEHLRLKPVLLFIALLFMGQQIEGTSLTFSILTSTFIALSAVAFNLSGGFTYPSGAYIFCFASLTSMFGLTAKIFLFEPGERNLLSPNTTMLAYCGVMFAMGAAAALNQRLRVKRGLLPTVGDGDLLKRSAIGCVLLGILLQVTTGHSTVGSFGSAFRQVNHFGAMGMLLATTYEVRRSGGRRSTNWIVWLSGITTVGIGLITFSKEDMFLGPTQWLIAAILGGYNFSIKQVVGCLAGAFVAVYWLVPYSQYVRNFKTESRAENLATAFYYIEHLSETREQYLEKETRHDFARTAEPHLYDFPVGFLDRLNMLAFDDALIHLTDDGYVYGLGPTFQSYANIVPHFLWPNKPEANFGNSYAHELGVLGEDDTTTGISFSAVGDAYHESTWFGILLVWPIVIFLFFFITDSLTGSSRDTPWALLSISLMPHSAPEGMMSAVIFLSTYGVVTLLLIVMFSRYLLPLLTGIFFTPAAGEMQPLSEVQPARSP